MNIKVSEYPPTIVATNDCRSCKHESTPNCNYEETENYIDCKNWERNLDRIKQMQEKILLKAIYGIEE